MVALLGHSNVAEQWPVYEMTGRGVGVSLHAWGWSADPGSAGWSG
jgi:hypothetical protein